MWEYDYSTLCHHGILGQKWGVRRFQNPDGTLTPAGKKRYAKDLGYREDEYGNYTKKVNSSHSKEAEVYFDKNNGNKDIYEICKKYETNYDKYEKQYREDIANILSKNEGKNVNEIINKIGKEYSSIYVTPHSSEYTCDDGGLFGGHILTIEINNKTAKTKHDVQING